MQQHRAASLGVGGCQQILEEFAGRLLALLAATSRFASSSFGSFRMRASAASIQSRKNCTLLRLTAAGRLARRNTGRWRRIGTSCGLLVTARTRNQPLSSNVDRRQAAFLVFPLGEADFGFDRAVLDDLQILDRHARGQVESDFERQRFARRRCGTRSRAAGLRRSAAAAGRW